MDSSLLPDGWDEKSSIPYCRDEAVVRGTTLLDMQMHARSFVCNGTYPAGIGRGVKVGDFLCALSA